MNDIYKVKPSQIVRRDNGEYLDAFPSRRQARKARARVASSEGLQTYEVKIVSA